MSTTAAAALAKRRVRRQKQFIAVGSVILLALLGYQLPKLLGGHRGNTAAPRTTPAATTTANTTSSGATGAAPTPGAVRLRDTDGVQLQRDTSQLLSFGLFKTKDPFVQQLDTVAAAPTPTPVPAPAPAPKKTVKPPASAPTTPTTTVSAAPPVVPEPAPTTPTATTPSPAPVIPPASSPSAPTPATPSPTPVPASPASVLISTNGVCEQIAVNGTFPANEDLFRLVEIAKNGKSVKIAIVGGSYDSGAPTATAELGKKLTLVNTSDGSRYVIVLHAKCAVVAKPPPATTTTTTTAVVPPPSPALTPQTTTPIVPDAGDGTPAPTS
jgi:hypothetical protein